MLNCYTFKKYRVTTNMIKKIVLGLAAISSLSVNAEIIEDSHGMSINKGEHYINTHFLSLVGLNSKIGNVRTEVIYDNVCENEVLQVTMPAKAVGSASGVSYQYRLPEAFNDLYLTYTVKFDDDFDFSTPNLAGEYSKNTGKLPGLSGGDTSNNTGGLSDVANKNRGFSVRLNWRENGKLNLYVYHLGQQSKYGDDFILNLKPVVLIPGNKYVMTLHLVMNENDQENGVLELFVNGEKVADYNDIEFRNEQTNSGNIERLAFSSFLGGSGDRYWHKHQEKVFFSQVALHTRFNSKHYDLSQENCLLDLAEVHCSNFFSSNESTSNQEYDDYLYRRYDRNYLGIKEKSIFVMGDDFPDLLPVGEVDSVIDLLSNHSISECSNN